MSFDSVTFWIFFAVALLAWRGLPFRAAKAVMLWLSLGFYAWWSPWYLPLIALSSLVDYRAGAAIQRAAAERVRRRWLLASLAVNLGSLGAFKYGAFALDSLEGLSRALGGRGWDLGVPWVIPVGISFYTFQTLSYTIDVYRRRLVPVASFGDFFLFVSFFPQLVAGPIVRAHELLPQLERRQVPSFSRIQHGAYLIVWGLFLKVVVADNLAQHVDRVFALAPSGLTTPLETWLGMGYFGVQVFADFAGYSAIAIGLASLMGLRFPRNFLYPFLARGPTEFWSRWHVTLSTWLRDYLYVPLGGNRRGRARTYVNLMITMVLAGVWHGAAWTVIAWGGLHGLGMCVDRALRRRRPADWPVDAPRGVAGLGLRALQILAFQVFLHTGWTLFRAPDFATTAALLERLWVAPFREGLGLHRLGDLRFLVLVAPVVLMHAVRALNEWYGVRERSIQRVVAAALMLVALVLLRRDVAQDFFYFQF